MRVISLSCDFSCAMKKGAIIPLGVRHLTRSDRRIAPLSFGTVVGWVLMHRSQGFLQRFRKEKVLRAGQS
jgi:hypothetical protein